MLVFLKNVIRTIVRVGVYPVIVNPIRWFDRHILSEVAFRCHRTDYSADPGTVKRFSYRGQEIKAHVQSYFDYWRIDTFEKHPIDNVVKHMELENNQEKYVVYYEIGANIGYSVLVMGKLLEGRGEVVTFEVEPTNFKTLSDNIMINQLDNVVAMQLGVGETSSIQNFYYNRYHDKSPLLASSGMGMHSLEFDPRLHDREYCYKVPLMPLDSIIKSFALSFPTHIFIDAYGAEDAIVSGMRDTLEDPRLRMVMVDVENKPLNESFAHKNIILAGFELVDCTTEEGLGVVPTCYRATYERIEG